MEIAKVKVSGARCTPESVGTITRGMVGATVSIEYTDPLWENLTKTVVFRGVVTKDVLNAGNVVTVPAEVVTTAGQKLSVGVYGVDADNNLVIPTLWAELGEIRGAASPSGDSTTEATPPVWAQIQAVANNAEAIANSVREDADAGAFIGPVGPTGAAAVKLSDTVEYQSGTSGDAIPSGTWSTSIPHVLQGEYLWTRTTTIFNTGTPVVSYSVSRFGLDGAGSVSSVCGVSPTSGGDVVLSAENVGALPSAGGDMNGVIRMNGKAVTGLNDPEDNTDAARKGYVDSFANSRRVMNLLDNSDFRNPVNQRNASGDYGSWGGYNFDRWRAGSDGVTGLVSKASGISFKGTIVQTLSEEDIAIYNNKKLTFAVKVDGTVYCCSGVVAQKGSWNVSAIVDTDYGHISFETENNNQLFVIIANTTSATVEWAALYEGEYTVETLPPYVPKGYAAELAECQRYYQRLTYTFADNTQQTDEQYPAIKYYILPMQMRITPTAVMTENWSSSIAKIEPSHVTKSSFCISVVTTTSGAYCSWNGLIELNADLL